MPVVSLTRLDPMLTLPQQGPLLTLQIGLERNFTHLNGKRLSCSVLAVSVAALVAHLAWNPLSA